MTVRQDATDSPPGSDVALTHRYSEPQCSVRSSIPGAADACPKSLFVFLSNPNVTRQRCSDQFGPDVGNFARRILRIGILALLA